MASVQDLLSSSGGAGQLLLTRCFPLLPIILDIKAHTEYAFYMTSFKCFHLSWEKLGWEALGTQGVTQAALRNSKIKVSGLSPTFSTAHQPSIPSC